METTMETTIELPEELAELLEGSKASMLYTPTQIECIKVLILSAHTMGAIDAYKRGVWSGIEAAGKIK